MAEPTKKPNQKPNRKRGKKPMSKPTLVYIVFWLMIIGLSFVFVVNQAGRYNELRQELVIISDNIENITAINYELQLQIDFFDSDAYIEQRAREWLGMVRPNEMLFRNIAE